MRRELIQSSTFVRAAKRFLKKHPSLGADLRAALEGLVEDAFNPRLRTHKLQGELDGLWAASAGYDVRIIFSFVSHEGREAILLQTLGSHEDVY